MKLILGSKSKYRYEVLKEAGYEFDTMSADIDERSIRSEDYEQLPLLIAKSKALKLLREIHEDAILITSDQVVVCNGKVREKPTSKEQAKEYLESYAFFPAQTITAVVVTNTKNGKNAEGIDSCRIYFNPIPSNIISKIIENGEIFNTAGGFITESELFSPYIDHYEGTLDSIRGLPVSLLNRLIGEVS